MGLCQYAFEGPHLKLNEGYSKLAEAIFLQCKENDRFKCLLNSPVKKIEYGLSSLARSDVNTAEETIPISDTCRIMMTESKNEFLQSDFVVCALPLGVLKSSQKNPEKGPAVIFDPPLPDNKRDCIEHIGFGVLNKVFLQFSTSFWRKRGSKEALKGTPFLSDTEVNFGNASSVNPEYYMFFDVGFDVNNPADPNNPHILHTLVSGIDAVDAEKLSDEIIVDKVMKTLKYLFSDIVIPRPRAFQITRWCSDSYSFGAYSFLAPGSTDQDYLTMQAPICSDGDYLQLGDSKTMRVFFAGEHTSTHYPSLAHGAYISGLRAAREIMSNIKSSKMFQSGQDRVVPITRYRLRYPKAPLHCILCDLPSTEKEGDLISFQKDKRIILIHKKCALYSPDVSFNEGVWHNVIKCVNRGRQLRCVRCKKNGATIGCGEPTCKENYHFGCCDPAWSFEENGKSYYCASHRKGSDEKRLLELVSSSIAQESCNAKLHITPQSIESARTDSSSHYQHGPPLHLDPNECTPMLLANYKLKNPSEPIVCVLCKAMDKTAVSGEFLAFQKREQQVVIHENCLKASNIIKCSFDTQKYRKVFEIVNAARTCFRCYQDGATLRCNNFGCFRHYHFECAMKMGCNDILSQVFFCLEHKPKAQMKSATTRKKLVLVEPKQVSIGNEVFSHDLFYKGAYRHDGSQLFNLKKRKRQYSPSNEFSISNTEDTEALKMERQAALLQSSSNLDSKLGDEYHTRSSYRNATFPAEKGITVKRVRTPGNLCRKRNAGTLVDESESGEDLAEEREIVKIHL